MTIVFIIIAFIFWPIWFYTTNVSTDYPLISKDILESSFNLPYSWQYRTAVGWGENALFTLWSWPLDFLYGVLGKIGVSFDIIQALFIIVIILTTLYSINSLGKALKFSYKARIASSLFYMLNSYFLLLIDGGQLNIALAYAILPLAYLKFINSIRKGFYEKIVASLIVYILGATDIRFLYLFVLIILLRFTFEVLFIRANILYWIKSGLVLLFVFSLLNFYWLWPVYNFGLEVPTSVLGSENISFLSFAKLKHGALLLQPHWYKNAFGQISAARKEFILIPALALLGILTNSKKKEVYFWMIISALGILLVKGNNQPFVGLYKTLFENIPGFSIFRDPTKFFIFITLGYSVLIGYAINKLVRFAPAIFGAFLIYLIILASPVYLGKMTGLFSRQENLESFQNVQEILKNDTTFGRVLWLPYRHELAYVSTTHPVVEGTRISNLRPFAVGNFGMYESLNFLRESGYIGQLLNLSAIEYIAYTHPNENKKELSEDEKDYFRNFSDQLANEDYLDPVYRDDAVTLYKVEGEIEKFFLAENSLQLNESDEIWSIFNNASEFKLRNNVLIVKNQSNSEFFYPSEFLLDSPNQEGWWKRDSDEFFWLRDFMQQKYHIDNQDLNYGGGYAICEGKCIFKIPDEVKSWEKIYIRLLEVQPEFVNKKITGTENTPDQVFEFNKAKFVWKEINESQDLLLNEPINIINVLSPYKPFSDSSKLVKGESDAKVNYVMLNPAHYKVTVSNLNKPETLIFSESFSPYWKLNDQNSFKAYDLFNGFNINENGEYDLYFEPQEYVNKGFVVSVLSALVLITYIINYGKTNRHLKN